MSIRHGLKSGLMALGAVTLLGVGGSSVLAQTTTTRQSLLGIRLYDSYTTVLKKYGPPKSVRAGGDVTAPDVLNKGTGAPGLASAGGGMGMMGGMMGGGMPGMGGPPAGIGGMMASMGGRGGGMPGMGGPPAGAAGMMAATMSGRGGGLPGFSSGKRGGDDESGAPAVGTASVGGTASAQEEQDPGEAYWWYTFKKPDPRNKERLLVYYYGFLFNRDGKVIQIQEYGYAGGSPTSKGVGLGDTMNRLLRVYGWSNDGEQAGTKMTFRYGVKEKTAFQIVKDQVIGITLAAVK